MRCLIAMMCVLPVVLACAPVMRAHAFEIRVRGQGKLYVDVQPAGITLQVMGSLRDELGTALPQRDVELQILSANSERVLHTETLVTDMRGRFQLQRAMDEGDYIVTTRFVGSEHLDGDRVEREVGLSIIPPRVDIHTPRLVVGTSRAANLRVRASASGIGLATAVNVFLNGSQVTRVELDPYGRGALDLVSFLEPGENVIEVRLPKERKRPAASDASSVRFSEVATLTVEASTSHRRLERGLVVTGRVEDDIGPLERGAVEVIFERVGEVPGQELDALEEGDAPVAQKARHEVRTRLDEGGTFEGFLAGQHIDDGQWRARVIYRPDVGEPLEATTRVMTFDRTRSRWLLNVLGLLAILIGVVVLINRISTIDFRALLARLRRERAADKSPAHFAQDEPAIIEAIEPPEDAPEVQDHRQIAGVIWDGWRRRAVAFATIELSHKGEVVHKLQSMSDGRFHSPVLEEGAWQMKVTASGYARGVHDFEMPHGGELRFFRFGVVAVALKIRRFYQDWVRRVQGEDLWGKLSPRQIEGAIRGALDETSPRIVGQERRDQLKARLEALLEQDLELGGFDMEGLLLAVTEIVEESYFSGRAHDEELWSLLVAIIERLDELVADASGGEA